MIRVLDVLKKNEEDAVKILNKRNNCVMFVEWDDNKEVYSNADECPYIRYSNDDGEISAWLVVGVRYNTKRKCIEILATDNEYKKTDGEWFPLNWADDISYWYVLEYLEHYE